MADRRPTRDPRRSAASTGSPLVSDDPRVRRTRRAVLDAVRAILLEEGQDAVTHLRVAERSGVGRATLYRHWPDRTRLLIEALVTTPRSPEPIHDDLRLDLIEDLRAIRHNLVATPLAPILATLIERAEWDAELRAMKIDLVHRSGERLRRALGAAVCRGELPPDLEIDRAIARLTGPLFFRRFLSGEEIPPDLPEALVDDFLAPRR